MMFWKRDNGKIRTSSGYGCLFSLGVKLQLTGGLCKKEMGFLIRETTDLFFISLNQPLGLEEFIIF